MTFGPDISWPNGFRRLDTESRRILEAGYGTGGYRTGQYDHVDPRYAAGSSGPAPRRGYQQPAMDDYGYGDPGYSDPSYDGPRNQFTGPIPRIGYTGPQRQASYQPNFNADVYPTTGAQEALPATGPQPIAGYWTGQGPGGYSDQRRSGAGDGPRYEEPRFDGGARSDGARSDGARSDGGRFDGGRPRQDDPRAGGPRVGGTHTTDPRLEGIRYDELRYDEPAYDDEPAYGGSRFDQPGDDVSWYEDLRRSAPAYPDRPGGQPTGGQRPADSPRPGDSRGPSRGQQSGYSQPPSRPSGPSGLPGSSGPSGPAASFGPSGPSGPSGSSGYGQSRDDVAGHYLQMRAAREINNGPRPGAGPARPSALTTPQALQAPGFREAATVQVGVLTPPSGTRMYTSPPAETTILTAPPAGRTVAPAPAPAVRPGHGLDGPEITGSWPAQPQTDEVDQFEDFWREDDDDEEYRGLFADEDQPAGSRSVASRRIGRRRGRSTDHRLWLALLGVVIAAAAAITAIIKFEFPSHGGPVHSMQTPAKIGAFARTVDMEKSTHLSKLRADVIRMSAGEASNVKSAVYESGTATAGSTVQIVMFIGGNLANAAPGTSIGDFTKTFPGAKIVSPGSLGGQAACVEEGAATSNPASICVWFDNDSFGEIVSPTLNATQLAHEMLTIRPDLETVVKS